MNFKYFCNDNVTESKFCYNILASFDRFFLNNNNSFFLEEIFSFKYIYYNILSLLRLFSSFESFFAQLFKITSTIYNLITLISETHFFLPE